MDPGLKLFVKHLPQDWNQKMVFEFFSAYGIVSEVVLFTEAKQSKGKSGLGCAYVRFVARSEGEDVMAKLNHSQVL
jgi:RNA recognition motif-containing protein